MSLNLGHLGSKTRSLGQIKEIPFGHSRGHIFCSIDLKIFQNVCLDEISDELELRSPGVKNSVKLKKYLLGALRATFLAQLT